MAAASKRLTKAALTLLKPSAPRHFHSSSARFSAMIPRSVNNIYFLDSSDRCDSKYTVMAWEALKNVEAAARENKPEWVETEHLMKALLELKDGLARRIFRRAGLDSTSLLQATHDFLSKHRKVSGDKSGPIMGQYMTLLLENAGKHKNDMKDEVVSVEHFILAFCLDRRFGHRLFRNLGRGEKDLRDAVDAVRGSMKIELNDQWGMEKELIQSLKEEIDRINVAMEAGTRISLKRQLEEAENHLAEVESKWTGTHLEDALNEHVVGQEMAVKSVADAIRRSRAGLSDPNRPIASFMLRGLSWEDEDKLPETLARYLFNSEHALVTLDMSLYEDSASFSVGPRCFDVGEPLTELVRRRPYCVILISEIHYARKDALTILSELLENGRIADCNGRTVSFKNTVIVMTSCSKLARKTFRHEFMNHIDHCIEFNPITDKEVEEIKMSRLKEKLKQRNIELHYTKEVIDMFALEKRWSIRAKKEMEKFMERSIARGNFKKAELFVLNVYVNPDLGYAVTFGKPTCKPTHFLFCIGGKRDPR